MRDNLHMFYAGPMTIPGCNCLVCVASRRQVWDTNRFNLNGFSVTTPKETFGDWLANMPTERSEKGFTPSRIYQINYSIVDNYGFASTHSVVLKTWVGKTPQETFSDFMDASEGYVRYDLIEYFLVRWENGEYVKV